jgi:hypothetical protein
MFQGLVFSKTLTSKPLKMGTHGFRHLPGDGRVSAPLSPTAIDRILETGFEIIGFCTPGPDQSRYEIRCNVCRAEFHQKNSLTQPETCSETDPEVIIPYSSLRSTENWISSRTWTETPLKNSIYSSGRFRPLPDVSPQQDKFRKQSIFSLPGLPLNEIK